MFMDENFFNDECPMCGDEGAYFDFDHWECPNCDYSWGWIDYEGEEENGDT
jgi:uncharacterized Zn ribbon protein